MSDRGITSFANMSIIAIVFPFCLGAMVAMIDKMPRLGRNQRPSFAEDSPSGCPFCSDTNKRHIPAPSADAISGIVPDEDECRDAWDWSQGNNASDREHGSRAIAGPTKSRNNRQRSESPAGLGQNTNEQYIEASALRDGWRGRPVVRPMIRRRRSPPRRFRFFRWLGYSLGGVADKMIRSGAIHTRVRTKCFLAQSLTEQGKDNDLETSGSRSSTLTRVSPSRLNNFFLLSFKSAY